MAPAFCQALMINAVQHIVDGRRQRSHGGGPTPGARPVVAPACAIPQALPIWAPAQLIWAQALPTGQCKNMIGGRQQGNRGVPLALHQARCRWRLLLPHALLVRAVQTQTTYSPPCAGHLCKSVCCVRIVSSQGHGGRRAGAAHRPEAAGHRKRPLQEAGGAAGAVNLEQGPGGRAAARFLALQAMPRDPAAWTRRHPCPCGPCIRSQGSGRAGEAARPASSSARSIEMVGFVAWDEPRHTRCR